MKLHYSTDLPTEAIGKAAITLARWPDSLSYFEWRLNPKHSINLVATQDNHIFGLLSAFPKDYRIAGTTIPILETLDWHVDRSARNPILGLSLMKRMLEHGKPLLAVGGSPQNRVLLPRLGFQTIAEVRNFLLPLTSGALTKHFGRGLRSRYLSLERLFSYSAFSVKKLSSNQSIRSTTEFPFDLMNTVRTGHVYDFLQLPTQEYYQWINEMPGGGNLTFLEIRGPNGLECFVALRIWQIAGYSYSVILDIFVQNPSREAYTLVIAELLRCLKRRGIDEIRTSTSCSLLSSALKAIKFHEGPPSPAFLHPNGLQLPINRPLVSPSRGDDSFFPLPRHSPIKTP